MQVRVGLAYLHAASAGEVDFLFAASGGGRRKRKRGSGEIVRPGAPRWGAYCVLAHVVFIWVQVSVQLHVTCGCSKMKGIQLNARAGTLAAVRRATHVNSFVCFTSSM